MSTRFEDPRAAMVGNLELSAVFRGRSFPIERLDDILSSGLPWVPTNSCISASNTIPADNPFGPMGETKLVAVPETRMLLPSRDDRPTMALYLAEITDHDGAFWEVCARSQLRRALADLKAKHGLSMKIGFEQELYIHGLEDVHTPAYSLAGSRRISGLAAEVQQILGTANTRVDQFAAEYGEHQFEISHPVRDALRGCDDVVLAREAIRDTARGHGAHATFAPKPDLAQAGSGIHIHFSLWDESGPRTAHSGALTATSGAFAAGILKHIEAVMAFATPSPNSFQRIAESSWVGVFSCLGIRNREAAIRLCPRSPRPDGSHPGASLEFRLCDGAANPYLALAALVRAGMAGLDEALDPPRSADMDPAKMTVDEREGRGYRRVPHELEPCLAAAAPLAREWFGELFWRAYDSVRRNAIKDAQNAGEAYPAALARAI